MFRLWYSRKAEVRRLPLFFYDPYGIWDDSVCLYLQISNHDTKEHSFFFFFITYSWGKPCNPNMLSNKSNGHSKLEIYFINPAFCHCCPFVHLKGTPALGQRFSQLNTAESISTGKTNFTLLHQDKGLAQNNQCFPLEGKRNCLGSCFTQGDKKSRPRSLKPKLITS